MTSLLPHALPDESRLGAVSRIPHSRAVFDAQRALTAAALDAQLEADMKDLGVTRRADGGLEPGARGAAVAALAARRASVLADMAPTEREAAWAARCAMEAHLHKAVVAAGLAGGPGGGWPNGGASVGSGGGRDAPAPAQAVAQPGLLVSKYSFRPLAQAAPSAAAGDWTLGAAWPADGGELAGYCNREPVVGYYD